ncbi:MAG: Zn-dependent oligopeptidase [Candidatus Uhrbacteria bacterium]|nr:Zn-dependent oligopeptidase [Candidatus Uhrbacteria bacterium]
MRYPNDPIAACLTPDGVIRTCDEALAEAARLRDEIARHASSVSATWEETFGAFDELTRAVQEAAHAPSLLKVVHPDAEVRAAAETCEPKIDAFISDLYLNEHVCDALKSFEKTHHESDPVHLKFMSETLRDYRRNGLDLDEGGRKKIRALNEDLMRLGQEFERHLAETKGEIFVTADQLEGLPETYVQNHPMDAEGKIRITTDGPDYVPFMTYAKDREAAGRLYVQHENRAATQNLPILDKVLAKRHEKALLLGYQTWAAYALETRMAGSVERVRDFIDELHGRIVKRRDAEYDVLREVADEVGLPQEPIQAFDASFVQDLARQTRFALDTKRLSEYFEIRAVLRGITDIASTLFEVAFVPVTDAVTWHEDVFVFDVKRGEGPAIGRLYLDLYPRDNKYQHAAMFTLRETMREADGSIVMPMVALVCNFPKPGQAPALLSHEDVTTFFHEFGHALHGLLSTSPMASFAGTSVLQDFVEVPSQLFEEWAWTRETLDLFARHYQTGERIPDDLFKAMTNARRFGRAIGTERQLLFADLDQTYHTREPGFDTTTVLEELYPRYSRFARIPGTFFQSHFGHLIGYDAAYYSYQWALAIVYDVKTRFSAEGIMNHQVAMDYLHAILEPGGTEDPNALIERFLGRPFSPKAYVDFLES